MNTFFHAIDIKQITHFTKLLTEETDPIKREILKELLTEEMIKQAGPKPKT